MKSACSPSLFCVVLLVMVAGCSMTPPPPPAASAAPPQAAASPPAPAPASAPAAKPADEQLSVAFAEGSAVLSETDLAALDHAARLYRDASPEVMLIAGHTDTTGDEYANLILSARRAESVKQALVERGVPPDRLQVMAIGAAQPTPGVTPSPSAVVTWR